LTTALGGEKFGSIWPPPIKNLGPCREFESKLELGQESDEIEAVLELESELELEPKVGSVFGSAPDLKPNPHPKFQIRGLFLGPLKIEDHLKTFVDCTFPNML